MLARALESGPKRCATARKAVLRKGLPLLLEARSSLKLNLPRIGERGDVALVGLREEDGAECDDALVPRLSVHEGPTCHLPTR